MTRRLGKGHRRWAPGVALVALVALGCGGRLLASEGPTLALINESPSLPRGIYVRVLGAAPARGSTVAVDPPSAARAYLAGLGMPRDLALLKRVAAVEGDRVCAATGRTDVAGRWVSTRARDRRGVPLPQWTGCRRLAPGELFLIGDTPGSFDSRYFGPVRASALDGVFREVLTW